MISARATLIRKALGFIKASDRSSLWLECRAIAITAKSDAAATRRAFPDRRERHPAAVRLRLPADRTHRHVEGTGAPGDRLSDTAVTENAERLAGQFRPWRRHRRANRPLAFPLALRRLSSSRRISASTPASRRLRTPRCRSRGHRRWRARRRQATRRGRSDRARRRAPAPASAAAPSSHLSVNAIDTSTSASASRG